MPRKKTPEFKEFWDAYGLKRDRIAAERAWNRLSAKDRTAAVGGIAAYREDCQRRGISMMYGQGYLSHRRWEDEPEDTPGSDPLVTSKISQKGQTPSCPPPLPDEMETW